MSKGLWPPPVPPEGPPNRTIREGWLCSYETVESKQRSKDYDEYIARYGKMMNKKSKAPWSDKQVKRLDIRQNNEYYHPYTCRCGEILKPINEGLVCPVACGYIQVWCHANDAGEE